jgi:hypothetical protein
VYGFKKSKNIDRTYIGTCVSHLYYFRFDRIFLFTEIVLLKDNTKLTEKSKNLLQLICSFIFSVNYFFRNPRMARCKSLLFLDFLWIVFVFFEKSFISDCPSGKLNEQQLVTVYKHFYPDGKVEAFCKWVIICLTFHCFFSFHIDMYLLLLMLTMMVE